MPTVIAADGVPIRYDVTGAPAGEPILCIQGLGADSRGWLWQRLALGRRYRVITFDNRGTGRSGAPPGPYDLDQMADDAATVMDAAGYPSAHVLGVSMGGAIAQKLALRHPGRVRSLILANTACYTHPWRREFLEQWIVQAQTLGTRGFLVANVDSLVRGGCTKWFWWVYARVAPLPFAVTPAALVSQVEACLAAPDHRPRLGEVQVPTLVVTGGRDRLTTPEDAAELAALIPGAELTVIPGASHLLLIEQPFSFNRVALRFLDRVTVAGLSAP
jgi:pimeloyl-ACP methyl ester carboxylesterase